MKLGSQHHTVSVSSSAEAVVSAAASVSLDASLGAALCASFPAGLLPHPVSMDIAIAATKSTLNTFFFILNNLLILVKYYLIKYETLFAFHKLPVFHIVHPTHFAGLQIQHIRTFSFDIQLCVLCLC